MLPTPGVPAGAICTMYSWSPAWGVAATKSPGEGEFPSGRWLLLHVALGTLYCVLGTLRSVLQFPVVIPARDLLTAHSLAGAAPDRRALALACQSAGTKLSKNDRACLQARKGKYPYLWILVKRRRGFFSSVPRRQARRARRNCFPSMGLGRRRKRGKSRKIIAEISARSRPSQDREPKNRRNLLCRRDLRIPSPLSRSGRGAGGEDILCRQSRERGGGRGRIASLLACRRALRTENSSARAVRCDQSIYSQRLPVAGQATVT